MNLKEKILSLINDAMADINKNAPNDKKIVLAADSEIFGPQRVLDSLGLIDLVMGIEHRIEAEFGITISLLEVLGRDPSLVTGRGTVSAIVDCLSKYLERSHD